MSSALTLAVVVAGAGGLLLVVAGDVLVWRLLRRTVELPTGNSAPVLVIAEELASVPDEGYTRFVREVTHVLAVRRRVACYFTSACRWDHLGPVRALNRCRHMIRAARRRDLARPAVVAYASRSSVTVMALLRARALKLLFRGAPVAVIALQDFSVWSGRLLRLLAPDLLLAPTERDCDEARRAGVNAARIWSGVDLERFRPALDGEKVALRRRWGLPTDRRIVLHVGHLRDGRNLSPLAALAGGGATVVLCASGWRGSESARLKGALTAAGVVVLDGYQPRVEELYRLADCYVFPTESRGSAAAMPLSVLEALASGLPVASLKFGALAEYLADAPAVALVDSPADLVESALALAGSAVRARPLAEPYAWPAVGERLLGLLDDLTFVAASAPPVRVRLTAVRAKVRRSYVAGRAWLRQLAWGGNGPERRPATRVSVVPSVRTICSRAAPEPDTDVVGLLSPGPDEALAAAARLLGLSLERAEAGGERHLIDRALTGRWPILHSHLAELDLLSGAGWAAVAAFVDGGGTLYVDGIGPAAGPALARLGRQLGLPVPAVTPARDARSVAFLSGPATFAQELAGARLEASCSWPALAPGAAFEVLALGETGEGRLPLAVRRRLGRGAVVLTTAPSRVEGRLADAFLAGSTRAPAAVLPVLLLRSLYGPAAWHPPAVLANFTIDAPALRRGLLGLRWDVLLGQARDHGFHVTVAAMPRELRLAEPAVVELLRRHSPRLSVCYHDGCGACAPDARHSSYRPRPLAAQQEALECALAHGRRFAADHGLELDRVMVFPCGIGPAEIFPDLHRRGFIGTCSCGDKHPPGSSGPTDVDLGLRPADLAWAGFPVLWRRGLEDRSYPLDMLLGRPVLAFAHTRGLGTDFRPFVERAAVINRLAGGGAAWCGLDEVARHAYLQRWRPNEGWRVLMTANEACLHNPGPAPRRYAVSRPHRPPGSVFEVDGFRLAGEPEVTVQANGTTVVRLVDGAQPGAAPRQCSVFRPQP